MANLTVDSLTIAALVVMASITIWILRQSGKSSDEN
jgi:hypothetical protein